MSPSTPLRRLGRRARSAAVLIAAACAAVVAFGERASASTTVVYDEAPADAPDIGIVGDSTLSGVRWYATYGDLERFNFIFDAESCRRTLETSCWSREGYRPENAIGALRRLAGQWGDVLVVMSGYNDSSYLFDDAVDAVVAEAQQQGIPHVIWMSLRTSDVSYEEPMHEANANTYRESNRILYQKAEALGGYLQVAEWAAYSADKDDWFEYDGVHLTIDGVHGVTTFIAEQVDAVLAGRTITPDAPPWVTLENGDSGGTVIDVQEALLAAGVDSVGGADGVFGGQTETAVGEFQQSQGLPVTGTVDEQTAIALGVHEAPPPSSPVERAVRERAGPSPTTLASVAPAVTTEAALDESSSFPTGVIAAAPVGLVALTVLIGRWRGRRLAMASADVTEPVPLVPAVNREPADRALPMMMPYDYEREDALTP